MKWFTETMVALHRCQIYGECGPIPHWAAMLLPVLVFIAVLRIVEKVRK